MEKLFGVEMNVLAVILAGGTIVVLLAIFLLALRNKVLLKLALRNIPRRKAQSILIVVGLMLSTTIIMSALAIGDSVSSSIRSAVLDAVGETDVRLVSPVGSRFGDDYLDASLVDRVREAVVGDERVDGVMPLIRESLPVLNELTDKTFAGTSVVGIDLASLAGFDGLKSVDGDHADLRGLTAGKTVINRTLAKKLEAEIGDDITLVAPSGRGVYRVIDIVEDKGLAGGDEEIRSAALFSVETLQGVLGREGQYNMIEVSVTGGLRVDEDDSDDLAEDLQLVFINDEAANTLFNALKSTVIIEALQAKLDAGGSVNGPFASDTLADLVVELENDAPTDEFRVAITNTITLAIIGGVIEEIGDPELAQSLLIPASQLVELQVDAIKNQGLVIAELVGGFIVALFSIFGSFSIIVGLLLIFLVFVMLAAARTTEMGIIRAVGTKRRHLVQMFAYEGIVYSIGAALLGTILGLVASVALVGIMSGLVAEDDNFSFSYNVTLQSIVVAFSLGLVLTAITVAISSYRVSKLNIVVAIRGLGQEFVQDEVPSTGRRLKTALRWLGGPLTFAVDTWREIPAGHRRWMFPVLFFTPFGFLIFVVFRIWKPERTPKILIRFWVLSMWTALVIGSVVAIVVIAADGAEDSSSAISLLPLICFMIFLWKMFKFVQPWLASGWPLLPIGALVALLGFDSEHGIQNFGVGNAALFTSGTTLIIIGAGLVLRGLLERRDYREEYQKRVSMTSIGVAMLIFWGLPFDALDGLTGRLSGGPEMFLLSGVSLVAAAVWIVMYNADVIVWVVSKMIGRFGSLRPVVKMAIAYPMAARFRTGLTLAMFSLVIFTMMIFAILTNLGNAIEDEPDLVSGGFDIRARIDAELPIDDVDAVIAASGGKLLASDFDVITRQASLRVEARQDGAEDLAFKGARVRASDATWLTTNVFELTHWDPAYGSTSADIWAYVATHPSFAVVNGGMIETGGFGGDGDPGSGPSLGLKGIKANEPGEFTGIDITIRPPVGQSVGDSVNIKVIGVLHQFADSFEFGSTDIYMSPEILDEISNKPVPFVDYKFRLADASRAEEITRVLETVFIEHGMTATAIVAEIAENQSQNEAFNQLFQGFMGLGLLVGVASLGVVSFRAVVERRQSIGMMRALGYKGRMIQIQFLMESGIVAVFGSVIGIGLGALIGWNIFLSISAEADGLTYSIPWLNVTLIVVIAVVFSLITTFIPARQASKIKPSEALRY
ncbi:MAG TPA: FtsX-like permease family protein [Dehalococcoidia bacterium]|nr:FtsX-like permease family protein [Dehalococcoidia bacterium]HIK88157.1 FtsX-like permease family protein [Dehalococcoidia bacterium]